MNYTFYNNQLWKVKHLFTYTASQEHFTLDPGNYMFEVHGAQGGTIANTNKIYGGVSKGVISLKETTSFVATVGGPGQTDPGIGGYNGGGDGGDSTNSTGGGGASDIRLDVSDADLITHGFTPLRGLPNGYHELEYIEINNHPRYSGESRYVDDICVRSDIIPDRNTRIEIKCSMVDDGYALRSAVYGVSGYFELITARNKYKARYSNSTVEVEDIDCKLDEPHVFVHTSTSFSVDGRVINTFEPSDEENEYRLLIAGNNDERSLEHPDPRYIHMDENEPYKGRIYYCKIYDGDTIVCNLVPYIDDTGIVGLYDMVNDHPYELGSLAHGIQLEDGGLYNRLIVAGGGGAGFQSTSIPNNQFNYGGCGGGYVGDIFTYNELVTNQDAYLSGYNLLNLNKQWSSMSNVSLVSGTNHWLFSEHLAINPTGIPSEMRGSAITYGDRREYDFYPQTNICTKGNWVLMSLKIPTIFSPYVYLRAITEIDGVISETLIPYEEYDLHVIKYRPYGVNDLIRLTIDDRYWGTIITGGDETTTTTTDYPRESAYVYDVMYQQITSRNVDQDIVDLIKPFEECKYENVYADQYHGYAFGYGMPGGGGGGWYGGYASPNNTGGGGSGYIFTKDSRKPDKYMVPSKYYMTAGFMESGTAYNGGRIIIYEEASLASLLPDDEIHFESTGSEEMITIPPGDYTFKCYGGSGSARYKLEDVSCGGFAQGQLITNEILTLYCNVGGSGNGTMTMHNPDLVYQLHPTLSYNGGGVAGSGNNVGYISSGFGGGATDFRVSSMEEPNSLYTRIIVAGGAGGMGKYVGGRGGGTTGEMSPGNYGSYVGVGTQTGPEYDGNIEYSPGFGFGGAGIARNSGFGGAGGGGWYGGSGVLPDGSWDDDRGGCGGSGYVLTSSSSYKPSEYNVDEKYYFINDYQIAGHELPNKISKAVIHVNDVNHSAFLCHDSEGYKHYNALTKRWEYLSDTISFSDVERYGSYTITTEEGLDDEYDLYIFDEHDVVNTLQLHVVPNMQTIITHTTMPMIVTNAIYDEEYDEEAFERYIRLDRDSDKNTLIQIDIDKKRDNDNDYYRIYSAKFVGYNLSTKTGYRSDPPHAPELRDPDQYRDEYGNVTVAQYLLPIGHFSSTDTRYYDYIGIDIAAYGEYDIYNALCHSRLRDLYILLIVKYKESGKFYMYLRKFNGASGTSHTIKHIALSDLYPNNNCVIMDFLIDDTNLYLSLVSTDNQLRSLDILNLSTNSLTSTPLTSSGYTKAACGKLEWVNDDVICMIDYYSLNMYNVKGKIWKRFQFTSSTYDGADDFTKGSKYLCCISNGNYKSLFFINIMDWKTPSMVIITSPIDRYNTRGCYGDGKFYFVRYQSLCIIDEETLTIEKSSAGYPWDHVRHVEYANHKLIIWQRGDGYNGSRIFIYDIKRDVCSSKYLKWLLNPMYTSNSVSTYSNSASMIRPCSFKGLFFLPFYQLCMIDATEAQRYEFGYKCTRYVVVYDDTSYSYIDFDDRFVTLTGSSLSVHNGNIHYPLSTNPSSAFKTCHVDRSEYKKLLRGSLINIE